MPKWKQKTNLALVAIVIAMTVFPLAVSAAGLVPCGGIDEKPCTVEDAFVLLARVTNFLIAVAGVVSVYFIISSSFSLVVFSVGEEEKISQEKKALANAVVGFILAMMAYMIVATVVNYILLNGVFRESKPLNGDCQIDLSNPLKYLRITIKSNPCDGR